MYRTRELWGAFHARRDVGGVQWDDRALSVSALFEMDAWTTTQLIASREDESRDRIETALIHYTNRTMSWCGLESRGVRPPHHR